jgi:hypothetical protein
MHKSTEILDGFQSIDNTPDNSAENLLDEIVKRNALDADQLLDELDFDSDDNAPSEHVLPNSQTPQKLQRKHSLETFAVTTTPGESEGYKLHEAGSFCGPNIKNLDAGFPAWWKSIKCPTQSSSNPTSSSLSSNEISSSPVPGSKKINTKAFFIL